MLSALFVGMAVVEHDHPHDDAHDVAALPDAGGETIELTQETQPALAV
jgi:hypothetical protein